jgi:hypothetical protein
MDTSHPETVDHRIPRTEPAGWARANAAIAERSLAPEGVECQSGWRLSNP